MAPADRDGRRLKSRRGRETAEQYSWKNVTSRLFGLYDQPHAMSQWRDNQPSWNLTGQPARANSQEACGNN